jgi:hypothetical protein
MPNKWRLANYSFEPEVEDAMRAAYRLACETPHLKDMGGATIALVAEKIVEIGRAGETDPNCLYVRALRQVSHPAPRSHPGDVALRRATKRCRLPATPEGRATAIGRLRLP